MRNLIRKYGYLTVAVLLCCAPAALAGQTASMDLTSGGNNVLGNVYVGPYTATINGVTTPVICDDWANQSYVPETWTANVANLQPLGSGVLWNGVTVDSQTLNAQQEYDAVAWLITQMLNPPSTCPAGGNCDIVGDISYAIWQLTDPNDSKGTAFGNLSADGLTADLNNAQYWLNQALQNDSAGSYSNFLIYTPISGNPNYPIMCGSSPCANIPPQEFIVLTPESPAPILLGADLLGLAALIFLYRRRMVRAQS